MDKRLASSQKKEDPLATSNDEEALNNRPENLQSHEAAPVSENAATHFKFDSANDIANKEQPLLMKVSVHQLTDLFVHTARRQRDHLVAELKRFSIFNCLDNFGFERLATPHSAGAPKVTV